MTVELQMNQSRKFPTNTATNITHNVNLSFEIGTTHVNPTENDGTTIEDEMIPIIQVNTTIRTNLITKISLMELWPAQGLMKEMASRKV